MANFGRGSFPQIPTIVKNIIIINVLVFLIQNVGGAKVDELFALHYWESPYFRWWQLFTHMFMHASISHIFFNMFALWMFGSILESTLGPKRFLVFYFVCGLGAAFCHLTVLGIQFHNVYSSFMHFQEHPTAAEYARFLAKRGFTNHDLVSVWNANPQCNECATYAIQNLHKIYLGMINEATVGASGAVFGLLFGLGYLFPDMEFLLIFPPMPIKAKWLVTAYAAIELFSGIQNSAGDNVAHFAHLGGMLFAFILLKIWRSKRRVW